MGKMVKEDWGFGRTCMSVAEGEEGRYPFQTGEKKLYKLYIFEEDVLRSHKIDISSWEGKPSFRGSWGNKSGSKEKSLALRGRNLSAGREARSVFFKRREEAVFLRAVVGPSLERSANGGVRCAEERGKEAVVVSLMLEARLLFSMFKRVSGGEGTQLQMPRGGLVSAWATRPRWACSEHTPNRGRQGNGSGRKKRTEGGEGERRHSFVIRISQGRKAAYCWSEKKSRTQKEGEETKLTSSSESGSRAMDLQKQLRERRPRTKTKVNLLKLTDKGWGKIYYGGGYRGINAH